jgi:hypothetical protein
MVFSYKIFTFQEANACVALPNPVYHARRFYKRRADGVFAIQYIAVVQCTSMELFQRSVAPLVLKFGIHQEQAGRKGVRGGESKGE